MLSILFESKADAEYDTDAYFQLSNVILGKK